MGNSFHPSPLLGVTIPTTTWIKAITITSTQQQNSSDGRYLSTQYSCCRTLCFFFFCLPSVAVSSRNWYILPWSRRSLGGQRRPPLHDLTSTCADNRLSVLQVNRLSFSRRPWLTLVFPPLCRRPPATTKTCNPIPRCLATEVTLPLPAGDAGNGIQL